MYNLNINDFDVADAFGIAYYSNEVLTKRWSPIRIKSGCTEGMLFRRKLWKI
jgi:hypothetical protein